MIVSGSIKIDMKEELTEEKYEDTKEIFGVETDEEYRDEMKERMNKVVEDNIHEETLEGVETNVEIIREEEPEKESVKV